jgi:Predicted membrane protein
MRSKPAVPPASPPDSRDTPFESERDQTSQNIEAVLEFYTREEQKISRSQRILERISRFIGQPVFLGFILLFVALWMLANAVLRQFGMAEFDPAPFFWLQGIVGLGALLTATVVLTKQNRLAKLEEQRAHLDLKVTLLTEQKAAKLIDLLEELRRDLPNVRNRHDPEAAALQQSMNPDLVLAALDERSEPDERLKPAGGAKEDAGGNE